VADVGIVMDRTSFYAESGGQIFDTGMLTSPDGKLSIRIDNVQTFGAYVLHVGVVESGEVKVGDEVACHVDYDRRRKVTPNHTMTHVLNWALRKVLVREEKKEKIVDQKGSSVDDERLRFDFTCNKAIAPKSLAKVEKICQEWVANKMPIYTQLAPLQDAMRVQSLRAVFGEKYPDPVRMVSIGQDIQTVLDDPDNAKWEDFSIEFCGGTHLTNTSESEGFFILEEGGIAKGVRRLVCVTGSKAADAQVRAEEFRARLAAAKAMGDSEMDAQTSALNPDLDKLAISVVQKEEFRKEIKGMIDRSKMYKKKQMAELQKKAIPETAQIGAEAAEKGEKVVLMRFNYGNDAKLIRQMGDNMSAKGKVAAMLFSADLDAKKMSCYAVVSDEAAAAGVTAQAWVNAALAPMGGKGGGKGPSALGQAKTLDNAEAAFKAAEDFIAAFKSS